MADHTICRVRDISSSQAVRRTEYGNLVSLPGFPIQMTTFFMLQYATALRNVRLEFTEIEEFTGKHLW